MKRLKLYISIILIKNIRLIIHTYVHFITSPNMLYNIALLTLVLLALLSIALTLNIPLTRSRETCLVITQGFYEFEFVVSGNNEKEVRCVIQ